MKTHKKILIFISAAVLMIFAPLQIINKPVAADQYDDQISALQNDIIQYQAEAARLDAEAITLQSALEQLANQEAVLQTQINISQSKYDQLVQKIADTEKQISDNKDALGITIANMYVEDNITPVEMLFSSNNISDYMDKQEYRSSVRGQLTSTISKIKDLKAQLDQQKLDIEKVLAEQKSQRDQLTAKKNQQAWLLEQTKGKESAYQDLIKGSESKIAEARAIQAAIRAAVSRTGGGSVIDGGLLSDYGWNDFNCPMQGYLSTGGADGRGGDGFGYGCRQCSSYVAWKIAKATNFYPQWGDGRSFTSNAQAKFGVGDGQPHAGSIAVMDGGPFGHVAWVETDPYMKDGRMVIQVSQYNVDYGAGYGMYSLVEWSVNAFDHYVQIVK